MGFPSSTMIELSFPQLANASEPIVTTLLGIVSEVISQPSKALSAIEVTVFGITAFALPNSSSFV